MYSLLVENAIRKAIELHANQYRKTDPSLPYVSHLFHVAMILRQAGYSDEVVAAGLLHDVLEDTKYKLEDLEEDFGYNVASLVCAVTENKALKWEERKAEYIEQISTASDEVKAISCADKTHNLRTLLEAHREMGDGLWSIFSRGKRQTLDFYLSMLRALETNWSHPLLDDYRAVVDELRRIM